MTTLYSQPTAAPTAQPTAAPTLEPSTAIPPTLQPSTAIPSTVQPSTAIPSTLQTAVPTVQPTAVPTVQPTAAPTVQPTAVPTVQPTAAPTVQPTAVSTVQPTLQPVVLRTRTKSPGMEGTLSSMSLSMSPLSASTDGSTTISASRSKSHAESASDQGASPSQSHVTLTLSLATTGTLSCQMGEARNVSVFSSPAAGSSLLFDSQSLSFRAQPSAAGSAASNTTGREPAAGEVFLCPLLMESVSLFGSIAIAVEMMQGSRPVVLNLTFNPANLTVLAASLDNVSISQSLVSFQYAFNITDSASATAPQYALRYPMSVALWLHRAAVESCLSTNNSLRLLNCTDTGPVLPEPIVSAAAAAVVQTAMAGSVALAAAGGPASAGDVQATAIIGMSKCARPPSQGKARSSPGDFKLVSPVALWDTPAGVLTGNAVLFGSVAAVQLLAVAGFRVFGEQRSLIELFAHVRFPAISVIVAASLHQSTLFSALHILLDAGDRPAPELGKSAHESNGFLTFVGAVAVLVAVAFPLCLVVAATFIPRIFLRYEFESAGGDDAALPDGAVGDAAALPGTGSDAGPAAAGAAVAANSSSSSSPRAMPPWYRHIVPFGTIQPLATKQMASSLITAFRHPSPWCTVVPFVSSFAVNLAAFASASTCKSAMVLSGVLHVAVALLSARFNIYNSLIGGALSMGGLLLLAAFQFLVAAEMHGVTTSLLLAQAALSVLRTVATFGISHCDELVRKHPSTRMALVVWTVGGAKNSIPKWFSNKSLGTELGQWMPRWFGKSLHAEGDGGLSDADALNSGGNAMSVLMVPMLHSSGPPHGGSAADPLQRPPGGGSFASAVSLQSDERKPMPNAAAGHAAAGDDELFDMFFEGDDAAVDPFADLKPTTPGPLPPDDPFAGLDDDDPFAGLLGTGAPSAGPSATTPVAAAAAAAAATSVDFAPDSFHDASSDANSDLDEGMLSAEQLERLRQHNRLKHELKSFFNRSEN